MPFWDPTSPLGFTWNSLTLVKYLWYRWGDLKNLLRSICSCFQSESWSNGSPFLLEMEVLCPHSSRSSYILPSLLPQVGAILRGLASFLPPALPLPALCELSYHRTRVDRTPFSGSTLGLVLYDSLSNNLGMTIISPTRWSSQGRQEKTLPVAPNPSKSEDVEMGEIRVKEVWSFWVCLDIWRCRLRTPPLSATHTHTHTRHQYTQWIFCPELKALGKIVSGLDQLWISLRSPRAGRGSLSVPPLVDSRWQHTHSHCSPAAVRDFRGGARTEPNMKECDCPKLDLL